MILRGTETKSKVPELARIPALRVYANPGRSPWRPSSTPAGPNKIVRPSQLILNQGRLDELNALFPQATFGQRVALAEGTRKIRSSTWLELQIMTPVVNTPFRLYWAYNPHILRRFIVPPVVTARSMFLNLTSLTAGPAQPTTVSIESGAAGPSMSSQFSVSAQPILLS